MFSQGSRYLISPRSLIHWITIKKTINEKHGFGSLIKFDKCFVPNKFAILIFSALVRVGEEDGAAQQRAADRGCAANQRWGMAAAATPQSIIQRSSPSDAFSPGIKNFTVLIELDLLDNNITALPAELGLLEPNLQVLKLDGNPLIRYLPRRYQPTLVKERQGIGAGRRDGGPPFCCAGTSHRNARSRTPRSCHCR
ncbi:hypothetical protein PVAP13_5NG340900 [Panicum virgatum]|uniref:Uncharacterized protein n=1 Tax=Panicum virgatum TaxID=38727 RepID=A0A8T0RQ92_PANVG|nr:hypothetical protein PVAP13_5NG340900 [Panicum virgatum]